MHIMHTNIRREKDRHCRERESKRQSHSGGWPALQGVRNFPSHWLRVFEFRMRLNRQRQRKRCDPTLLLYAILLPMRYLQPTATLRSWSAVLCLCLAVAHFWIVSVWCAISNCFHFPSRLLSKWLGMHSLCVHFIVYLSSSTLKLFSEAKISKQKQKTFSN